MNKLKQLIQNITSYFGYRKENLEKSVDVWVNRTIYYFILSPEEVEPDEFEFI